MIKNIPLSDRKVVQKDETSVPDTNPAPQGATEQFSSLMHKKEQPQLKELPKSKGKINQSIDKIEDKLAKQIAQPEEDENKQALQSPSPKRGQEDNQMSEQLLKTSGDKQSTMPLSKQASEQPGTHPLSSSTQHRPMKNETPEQPLKPSKDNQSAMPLTKQAGKQSGTHRPMKNETPEQLLKTSGDRQSTMPLTKQASRQSGTHQSAVPTPDKRDAELPTKAQVESAMISNKDKSPVHHQDIHTEQQSLDNKDLPQSLDAFDIASMIAQNQTTVQGVSPTTETTITPPADLNKIVGEIADRILVSSPADNPSGMQEIRIHLKESVLPDTEVRIYRHSGSLQVEFLTASKDSQLFIEQRQPDIQKVLGERLNNETVQVSVQDSQHTRGGQDQGRSRQQYIRPEQDDQ